MSEGRAPERADDAAAVIGFLLLWVLLDRSAALLASTRGEYGLPVCAIVLAGAFVLERLLSHAGPLRILADLGFRAPARRALLWALSLAGALLLLFPVFSAVTGTRIRPHPDAALLAVGILAQGGLAEELVFRGFLYRRLRAGRPFWRAAVLAAVPFTAVHLLLFATFDFPIAFAALVLALSMSFPLAWLFDRAGGSLWPGAILHAVVQGAIKLVDAGEGFATLAVVWMALCATAPWLVFLMRPRDRSTMCSNAH